MKAALFIEQKDELVPIGVLEPEDVTRRGLVDMLSGRARIAASYEDAALAALEKALGDKPITVRVYQSELDGPPWRARYFVESFTRPNENGFYEICLAGDGNGATEITP